MSTEAPQLLPAGDAALLIDFGAVIRPDINRRVHRLKAYLSTVWPDQFGPMYTIPGFASLLIEYAPQFVRFGTVAAWLMPILEAPLPASGGAVRRFRIQVAYGGEFGPDLAAVARFHGKSATWVVEHHSGRDYPIYCVGFSPGFPYLGGLLPELATPRLATPRLQVPGGSVGIGGNQTGIYPTASSGGWRIIGRTPYRLFDVRRDPPVAWRPGDFIYFDPIDASKFDDAAGRLPEGEPCGHD